jgi:hypothetical protein
MQSQWKWAGAALLAVLFAQTSAGQGILQFLQDPDPDVTLGWSVARLGDVDHDGTPDYAISGGRISTSSLFVRVISGRHASLLYEIPPFQPPFFPSLYGLRLAGVGDVDGDGTPDLAIGDWSAEQNGTQLGAVSLHSGGDGALLQVLWGTKWSDMFGDEIAGAGDVDGDGRSDVIVGAMQYEPSGVGLPGYAKVYSGASGQVLYHWTGTTPHGGFGWAVSGAGDVDGDGHADLAVGAALSGVNVWIFSGADGSVLHALDPGSSASCLAGGADLDGDGVPDLAVGSSNWGFNEGRLSVWSGRTWMLIFQAQGSGANQYLGSALDLIDDADGDGVHDVLVGALTHKPAAGTTRFGGSVRLFPGIGGEALLEVHGPPGHRMADDSGRLAALGDLDGDGLPEFAAASSPVYTHADGYVRVYSTKLLAPSTYGTPKVNSLDCTPELTWSGTPSLSGADDFVLRCSEVVNQKPGGAVWSESPALTPFQGGLLCVGSPRYVLAQMSSAGSPSGTDCTGVLTYPLTHALMQVHGMTSGMTICVQFYYRDPLHPDGTGVGLSAGVRFSLFP